MEQVKDGKTAVLGEGGGGCLTGIISPCAMPGHIICMPC